MAIVRNVLVRTAALCAIVICSASDAGAAPSAAYLGAVRTFADNVLKDGKDHYGPKHTPLFVDGLNIHTRVPAVWKFKGEEWILSNLGSQQNLFRTLQGLTALTGEAKYRAAVVEAMRFGFENLRSPNGLLYWAGHCAYNAGTEQLVGEKHGGVFEHELKRHYPFYEFMWEVDPAATKKYLEALWGAHILNWSNLEMNRHGSYTYIVEDPWKQAYSGGPVFFPGRGLSFVSTGSDLYYAAAMLHHLGGDPEPLVWARRMARRYVETRNPKTGLGGYQFTQYDKGDRAKKQFGAEFGDRALEGTLLVPDLSVRQFANVGACELMLGEMLGEAGRDFTQWALDDLAAYARHAYSAQDNTFAALITDGTKLSPADVKRKGYFGPVGSDRFKPMKAGADFFRAYALAYRISGDERHWSTARSIALGNDLGDIGEKPGGPPSLKASTECAEPPILLGLLDLHRKTGEKAYLEHAGRIGSNILAQRFREGFFVTGPGQTVAKFDAAEPLALLQLVAVLEGKLDSVPRQWPGHSYFHCDFDGIGRTYDNNAIYSRGRD